MAVRRYGPKRALNEIQFTADRIHAITLGLFEIGHSTVVKNTDLEKKLSEIAVRLLDLKEELEFVGARCTASQDGLNYRTESDILS